MKKLDNSNFVIFGENLKSLKAIEAELNQKVKCIYIDPPYNTYTLTTHFNDHMQQDEWEKMMKNRLIILRQLLSDNGTIWISINDSSCHSLKILCDKIFGQKNFLMTIIWEKDDVKDNLTPYIKESHDYILCYAKNRSISEQDIRKKFIYKTIWKKEEVGSTFDALREVEKFNQDDIFPTPKPENLIARIIEIATDPGDIILDCFGGSGTTGAVAHKMNRKWVIIEEGQQCQSHIIPRIEQVIDGKDQGGISQTILWQGGGNYQYIEI